MDVLAFQLSCTDSNVAAVVLVAEVATEKKLTEVVDFAVAVAIGLVVAADNEKVAAGIHLNVARTEVVEEEILVVA